MLSHSSRLAKNLMRPYVYRQTVAAVPAPSLRLGSLRWQSGPSTTETHSSTGSHENSGHPEEIELEKQRNLSGQTVSSMDHAPNWNEKLASTSEAHVKSDKDARSPAELQKHTTDHLANDASSLANAADKVADKAKKVAKNAKKTLTSL